MDRKYTLQELQDEVSGILRETIRLCDENGIPYYGQAGTVLGAVRHQGPIPWDYDADLVIPSSEIHRFVQTCEEKLPKKYWVNFHTVYPEGFLQFPRVGLRGYSTDHLHVDIFQLIGLPDDRETQLAMIQEGVRYRRQKKRYQQGLKGTAAWFKHGEIGEGLASAGRLIRKDTGFMERMDAFCVRYPYEEARFVMNPFGKYREKNIFRKEVYGEGQEVPYLDFKIRIPSEVDFYLKQYYGDYRKFPPQEKIDASMNHVFTVEEIEQNG